MKIFKRFYEGFMVILVMLTIITLWTNHTYNSIVNWMVWFIFFVDYIVRVTTTKQKWNFIKRNPFLLLAIIPLDQFFQIARIVRIVYLFRIKTMTKYYIQPLIDKISYQSKVIILLITLFFLSIESWVLWLIEANIETIGEAFKYVFLHLLFFGHRTVEVVQVVSLWILVFTTIIGVLFHGIALQWLFTKIEVVVERYKNSDTEQKQSL